ncbi:hypothetical protein HanRHA438_Chr04g0165421 [Helianthus annuus]|nr:hypothetical protein HanRHA438_Chr04g0165421 [Helianthus annuus]
MSTAKGRLPSAKMMERTIQGEDAACGKEEEKVSGGAHTQINPSHVLFFKLVCLISFQECTPYVF